ncbi:conserved hypothetical protein [Neospora caninum Liverpool]|uniref:Rad17 cell cycle checkpoint protein n=1 Tax=Neospora caninum (strain Liverpool) TaxID=572307 RepID=F0VF87_NEOCL|nr:conserved hypothetical protein [Neospora caninum Liverpool]CBZ52381.1 conserved hypothetical protein [Neospora caninum Liverpool]CEL66352.1 TPA: hypothetical protein BN1204_021700 [Neospora caninum Liverpool]|eukprot:XP_003882413.1 conserved hypothetical protein [Neospora caninum Liverpool]
MTTLRNADPAEEYGASRGGVSSPLASGPAWFSDKKAGDSLLRGALNGYLGAVSASMQTPHRRAHRSREDSQAEARSTGRNGERNTSGGAPRDRTEANNKGGAVFLDLTVSSSSDEDSPNRTLERRLHGQSQCRVPPSGDRSCGGSEEVENETGQTNSHLRSLSFLRRRRAENPDARPKSPDRGDVRTALRLHEKGPDESGGEGTEQAEQGSARRRRSVRAKRSGPLQPEGSKRTQADVREKKRRTLATRPEDTEETDTARSVTEIFDGRCRLGSHAQCWADKYAPQELGDLLQPPQKVQQIVSFLKPFALPSPAASPPSSAAHALHSIDARAGRDSPDFSPGERGDGGSRARRPDAAQGPPCPLVCVIQGPSGSGKRSLVATVAAALGLAVVEWEEDASGIPERQGGIPDDIPTSSLGDSLLLFLSQAQSKAPLATLTVPPSLGGIRDHARVSSGLGTPRDGGGGAGKAACSPRETQKAPKPSDVPACELASRPVSRDPAGRGVEPHTCSANQSFLCKSADPSASCPDTSSCGRLAAAQGQPRHVALLRHLPVTLFQRSPAFVRKASAYLENLISQHASGHNTRGGTSADGSAPSRFQPLVICIGNSREESQGLQKILPGNALGQAGILHVKLNPVATTKLRQFLLRVLICEGILSAHASPHCAALPASKVAGLLASLPPSLDLLSILHLSNGDVRHALTSLQFAAAGALTSVSPRPHPSFRAVPRENEYAPRKGVEEADERASSRALPVENPPRERRRRDQQPSAPVGASRRAKPAETEATGTEETAPERAVGHDTVEKRASLEGGKDERWGLFHALGKILYNKRLLRPEQLHRGLPSESQAVARPDKAQAVRDSPTFPSSSFAGSTLFSSFASRSSPSCSATFLPAAEVSKPPSPGSATSTKAACGALPARSAEAPSAPGFTSDWSCVCRVSPRGGGALVTGPRREERTRLEEQRLLGSLPSGSTATSPEVARLPPGVVLDAPPDLDLADLDDIFDAMDSLSELDGDVGPLASAQPVRCSSTSPLNSSLSLAASHAAPRASPVSPCSSSPRSPPLLSSARWPSPGPVSSPSAFIGAAPAPPASASPSLAAFSKREQNWNAGTSQLPLALETCAPVPSPPNAHACGVQTSGQEPPEGAPERERCACLLLLQREEAAVKREEAKWTDGGDSRHSYALFDGLCSSFLWLLPLHARSPLTSSCQPPGENPLISPSPFPPSGSPSPSPASSLRSGASLSSVASSSRAASSAVVAQAPWSLLFRKTTRPELYFSPEKLLEETPCDFDHFVLLLQENFLFFFSDVFDVAALSAHLADADALFGKVGLYSGYGAARSGEGDPGTPHMSRLRAWFFAVVSSRAVLDSNTHPCSPGSWPELGGVARSRLNFFSFKKSRALSLRRQMATRLHVWCTYTAGVQRGLGDLLVRFPVGDAPARLSEGNDEGAAIPGICADRVSNPVNIAAGNAERHLRGTCLGDSGHAVSFRPGSLNLPFAPLPSAAPFQRDTPCTQGVHTPECRRPSSMPSSVLVPHLPSPTGAFPKRRCGGSDILPVARQPVVSHMAAGRGSVGFEGTKEGGRSPRYMGGLWRGMNGVLGLSASRFFTEVLPYVTNRARAMQRRDKGSAWSATQSGPRRGVGRAGGAVSVHPEQASGRCLWLSRYPQQPENEVSRRTREVEGDDGDGQDLFSRGCLDFLCGIEAPILERLRRSGSWDKRGGSSGFQRSFGTEQPHAQCQTLSMDGEDEEEDPDPTEALLEAWGGYLPLPASLLSGRGLLSGVHTPGQQTDRESRVGEWTAGLPASGYAHSAVEHSTAEPGSPGFSGPRPHSTHFQRGSSENGGVEQIANATEDDIEEA